MAELSLILTSPSRRSAVTSIVLADTGTGVASIPPRSINALAKIRDGIIQMMNGAPRMPSNQLREFGQAIGKILFSDEIGDTWNGAANALQVAGGAGVPTPLITKLIATSAELKAIPWEYAAWPSGHDGPTLMNSVVRLVPQARYSAPAPLPKAGGLRILLLSASPLGLAAIPWVDLSAELFRAFSRPELNIEVVSDAQEPATNTYIRIVEAATRQAVQDWVGKDDPHIVHFVGHGTAQGLSFVDRASGRANPVSAAALQAILAAARSLRLLILSACDTANNTNIAPVDASIGTFAEQMVRNAVPAVIASQMVIDKTTIALFCEALYEELLASGSIDMAVAAGRCHVVEVLDEPDSAAIEWGIPVLYRRLGAAQLLV